MRLPRESQLQRTKQEQQIESFLGNLLRTGVIVSAALVVAGGLLFLTRHGTELADYRDFRTLPPEYRQPTAIVERALALGGRATVQLGLMLLIATPVARVTFSALVFAWQRDYTYVVLTLIVLSILLYSLLSANPL